MDRVPCFGRMLAGLAILLMVGCEPKAEIGHVQPSVSVFVVSELAADPSEPVDFARQVLPILSNKCFACHGPDTQREGLVRLDSYEAATHDLDGYKAIDPENLEESEILFRIHDDIDPMPPIDFDKQLTPAEQDIISRWIRQGGEYATHWAFVPPTKGLPDQVQAAGAIDYAVKQQLDERGVGIAPQADRATLARRASLVLTGLPPEPEALAAFLSDTEPGAYERFVDTLLDNPRFGEHQARFWLDAVRYGDTHGLHLDNKRGIYPYRDWLVRAFNDNLPLDEFIEWQLAGDLLDNPTLSQQVATGFIRMNPTTSEGGAIPEEFQAKNSFDRVETVGTVMMGMTLLCARCHTHKYDPITHTEYYELFAFFNNTAESPLDGNKYDHAPAIAAPANQAAWEQWLQLEEEVKQLVAQANQMNPAGEYNGDPFDELKNLAASTPQVLVGLPGKAAELQQRAEELRKQFTTTLVAKELPEPRETRLLERGEYNLPKGDPLTPGVFAVLGEFPQDQPANRLGFAKWLTARDHPLTSRVFVNRMWQRVFGYGLVRTPEDFGLQGEQPTHPELLDWLAVELQDSGWDLKHILKLMVTSETFKQNSAHRKDIDDPENRLFARGPGHRLDAEEIRDIALWASGLLREEMGGEGVKPYQPPGMWQALAHPASNTKQYVPDHGDKPYRRSLYVYWKRTSPHPMMTLFDAPSRESSCVRRSRTNTALQSLGLFNENQRVELSRVLAQRLMLSEASDADRLDLLFLLLASRSPSQHEREICLGLLDQMKQRYAAAEPDALALLAIGEAPRDESLDPAEHAAWTQVTTMMLASDIAIRLY